MLRFNFVLCGGHVACLTLQQLNSRVCVLEASAFDKISFKAVCFNLNFALWRGHVAWLFQQTLIRNQALIGYWCVWRNRWRGRGIAYLRTMLP